MIIIRSIYLFYKKIFLASIAVSIAIVFLLSLLIPIHSFIGSFGISYMFVLPLIHYYIYELRNRNEYYFYYNLGLSKISLWMITAILALVTKIISSLI